jgi:hypothetical protein
MLYQSKKRLSQKQLPALRSELFAFLKTEKSIYARFSKRHVFFEKLPDAITKRKDAARRLRAFAVALDILRKSDDFSVRNGKTGEREFEIRGQILTGEIVSVHVRESIDQKKDKKLQFISCFYSNQE